MAPFPEAAGELDAAGAVGMLLIDGIAESAVDGAGDPAAVASGGE